MLCSCFVGTRWVGGLSLVWSKPHTEIVFDNYCVEWFVGYEKTIFGWLASSLDPVDSKIDSKTGQQYEKCFQHVPKAAAIQENTPS